MTNARQRRGHRLVCSKCQTVIAMMIVLAACSAGATKVRSMFGGLLPMQVKVSPALNEDAPVAVDLVVVYDAKLLDALLKLPSAEWFAKKPQLLKDHPNALDVQSWEWTPGQQVAPASVAYHAGAKKIVLFADYQPEGDHRLTVDPQQPFLLLLGERDVAVEASK